MSFGATITEPYVQDFKTFLAGKKPATGRRSKKASRKTPAAKTSSTKHLTEAEAAAQADEAAERSRKLGAWMEVGATSLPALLVALGSALVGAITMVVRRRRRR